MLSRIRKLFHKGLIARYFDNECTPFSTLKQNHFMDFQTKAVFKIANNVSRLVVLK